MALFDKITGLIKRKSVLAPHSFHRGEDFPLDDRTLFGSLEKAEKYVSGATTTAYVGMLISVIEGNKTTLYTVDLDADGKKILTPYKSGANITSTDEDILITTKEDDSMEISLKSFHGGYI